MTLALIDPRLLTRLSLSNLLSASTDDFVILSFSSADELLCHLMEHPTQVAVIALNIGAARVSDEAVLASVAQLNLGLAEVPLAVISDRDEIGSVINAVRHGIRAYIPTTLTPSVAVAALRLVQAGGTFIPGNLLSRAFSEQSFVDTQHLHSADPDRLTPRQSEVLQLLEQGKSNKLIAYELEIQESTVKAHMREIMKKLNAANRTQAVFLVHKMRALAVGKDADLTTHVARSCDTQPPEAPLIMSGPVNRSEAEVLTE